MPKPTPQFEPLEEQVAEEVTVRDLIETEETSLLRYAFSLVGRRAVAEEIVQDVFLELHVHRDKVDSPKAWLTRCVRNRAYDYFRKSRREVLGEDDRTEPAASTEQNSPEAMLLRTEITRTLQTELDELTETDRQLVKLKYFEGLKYREISEATGLSVGNVGYRLHHILKELACKLGPLGIDETS